MAISFIISKILFNMKISKICELFVQFVNLFEYFNQVSTLSLAFVWGCIHVLWFILLYYLPMLKNLFLSELLQLCLSFYVFLSNYSPIFAQEKVFRLNQASEMWFRVVRISINYVHGFYCHIQTLWFVSEHNLLSFCSNNRNCHFRFKFIDNLFWC